MNKIVLFMVFAVLTQFLANVDLLASESAEGSTSDTDVVRTPPVVIKSFPPQFPRQAKRDKLQGVVVLKFTVTKNGEVTEISVNESMPKNVFDESAIKALKKYKFKPATENGEPVDCILRLPIVFSLDNSNMKPDLLTRFKAYQLVTSSEKMISEKEYRKAIDEITKAIELFPEYSSAFYSRAQAYCGLGDYNRALDDINQAISINSNKSNYLSLREEILSRQERRSEND
jgi:TonB family protein